MQQAIEETLSLTSGPTLKRRGFVLGSLSAGFAAAVVPTGDLLAQAIKTDSDGLTAGEVTIPVGNENIPAYRAMPTGQTDVPTVLVVQEIFGVHEHIQDICRRLAKLGYMAVATELYHRQGKASDYKSIPELITKLVSKVPDEQVMQDLDATVAWAGANGGDTDKLAITGFCWGGRVVWMYSVHNPSIKAGVSWYGRLTSKGSRNSPMHPVDVAGDLKAPVLGLYGGADKGIPVATIDDMKKRLSHGNANSKASEFVIYPDTPHAFNADYRASYRKGPATDGWQRMQAWLKKNGVF